MSTDLIRDVTELSDADPDAFSMHWRMIGQIHEEHLLHPCAEMLTILFAGTHHLYQFGVHFADCSKENHTLWIEDPEFVPWAKRELLSTFTEPVRAIHLHWRSPDFSVHSVVCEAQGYVHDAITTPCLGKALITPYSIGDLPMNAVLAVAREVWGQNWSEIPCTHKQQAMHEHEGDDE